MNAKALYGTITWKLIPLAMNMHVVNLRMRSHNLRLFFSPKSDEGETREMSKRIHELQVFKGS
jgi:hypothetical protein